MNESMQIANNGKAERVGGRGGSDGSAWAANAPYDDYAIVIYRCEDGDFIEEL